MIHFYHLNHYSLPNWYPLLHFLFKIEWQWVLMLKVLSQPLWKMLQEIQEKLLSSDHLHQVHSLKSSLTGLELCLRCLDWQFHSLDWHHKTIIQNHLASSVLHPSHLYLCFNSSEKSQWKVSCELKWNCQLLQESTFSLAKEMDQSCCESLINEHQEAFL